MCWRFRKRGEELKRVFEKGGKGWELGVTFCFLSRFFREERGDWVDTRREKEEACMLVSLLKNRKERWQGFFFSSGRRGEREEKSKKREGFVKGKEALSFGLTEERKFPLVFSKPRNEVGRSSLFKGDPTIFFFFYLPCLIFTVL